MKEEIDVICGGKFVFGNHEHYKLIRDFEIRFATQHKHKFPKLYNAYCKCQPAENVMSEMGSHMLSKVSEILNPEQKPVSLTIDGKRFKIDKNLNLRTDANIEEYYSIASRIILEHVEEIEKDIN